MTANGKLNAQTFYQLQILYAHNNPSTKEHYTSWSYYSVPNNDNRIYNYKKSDTNSISSSTGGKDEGTGKVYVTVDQLKQLNWVNVTQNMADDLNKNLVS